MFTFIIINATTDSIGGANKTWRTQTLGLLVYDHAICVWSTRYALTWMPTIVANVWCWTQTALMFITNGISWTIVVWFACDDSYATNTWVWIWNRTLWALTSEGASFIHTKCTLSTTVRFWTFIDINTLNSSISRKSNWALREFKKFEWWWYHNLKLIGNSESSGYQINHTWQEKPPGVFVQTAFNPHRPDGPWTVSHSFISWQPAEISFGLYVHPSSQTQYASVPSALQNEWGPHFTSSHGALHVILGGAPIKPL